jgi:hypothetical protein
MTYAQQKALFLQRLLARNYGATVNVPGDYALPSDALTAIKAIGDASASKRYRIAIAAGTYVESNTLDFTAAGAAYVDLVGANKTTTIIQCAGANKDVIKTYGANTLIRDLTISQTGSSGNAYAVHWDGSGASIDVLYNCILSATRKYAVGIGNNDGQRHFIVDCTLSTGYAVEDYAGLYYHPGNLTSGCGKLVVIGSTMSASGTYGGGARILSYGSNGTPLILLSGNTFTGSGTTLYGNADLRLETYLPTFSSWSTGTIPGGTHTWSGATLHDYGKNLVFKGIYNRRPWFYNNFVTPTAEILGGDRYWTLYYSLAVNAWVLYLSDSLAAATDPKTFNDGIAAASYFKWPTNYWNHDMLVPGRGIVAGVPETGDYILANAPVLRTCREAYATAYAGFADETIVFDDGTNIMSHYSASAATIATANAAAQGALASVRGAAVSNTDRLVTVTNAPLLALSWLEDGQDLSTPVLIL